MGLWEVPVSSPMGTKRKKEKKKYLSREREREREREHFVPLPHCSNCYGKWENIISQNLFMVGSGK